MNQNCKYTSCNQVKEAGDQKWANELIIIINQTEERGENNVL